MNRSITPDMTVGELLDVFPALEGTLMSLAPEFAKLRNPILRRTVAKVATLQQAARIGGLDVRELVGALRAAAGQARDDAPAAAPLGDACGRAVPGEAAGGHAGPAPAWFDDRRVDPPIDADAMLASGEHPLGLVRRRLATLPDGRILCIVASFRPVPLIDTLAREGYATWTAQDGSGGFRVYFFRT